MIHGRGDDAGAGGAERMADSDCATIRIDMGGIVGQTVISSYRQALRGERFVEFDDVHLREFEAGLFQHLLACEAHK